MQSSDSSDSADQMSVSTYNETSSHSEYLHKFSHGYTMIHTIHVTHAVNHTQRSSTITHRLPTNKLRSLVCTV